jgi:hypothetical protein
LVNCGASTYRPTSTAGYSLTYEHSSTGTAIPDWCFQFAAQLATAEAVDDLIVMATPDLGKLVLLEGRARLTAIFVGGLQRRLTIRAYLGLSAAIEQWGCF